MSLMLLEELGLALLVVIVSFSVQLFLASNSIKPGANSIRNLFFKNETKMPYVSLSLH